MNRTKTFLIILLIVAAGCSEKFGLPVRYIIPDGFKGLVYCALDTANGVSVPVTNGEYVVTIPQNGKLAVRSIDFMQGKHVFTGQYASGRELPKTPEEIGVYFIDVESKPPRILLYIGTQQESLEESRKILR